MKKTLLLVLMTIIVTTMTAGDVTPQQALDVARQFVAERMARHRSSAAVPQLQEAGKVSGLYVFNLTGRKGYVIVSGDDRTEAVLGYSNSGRLDPDNMPPNMRAWLQGYADEIAWMQAHPERVLKLPKTRRAGEVKAPIAPLIQTRWNQDEPYNNLTPYYSNDPNDGHEIYSQTYKDGYMHCATGCVATAMAQVMKFHEWPTETTDAIPEEEYWWTNAGIDLPRLPETTFEWNNMLPVYVQNVQNGYTQAEGDAVAKLMQYCGYSVEMNYGSQSGSNTQNVAYALEYYFGYNETTRYVSRNHYSYENWIAMIYNELQQGRPVVYGGASAGGGHEFVCDGYQGEDYFHINWGWGGESDDYFKLSALNPNTQGIGGSSSNDGYHYGQDAVVGIQKPGGTGTVLSQPAADYNLTLNTLTVDNDDVAVGQAVAFTANITNNSTEPYDADISLVDMDTYSVVYGQTFYIGAGETKDCIINYTPAGIGEYHYSVIHGKPDFIVDEDDEVKEVTVTVTAGSGNPRVDNIPLTTTLTVQNTEELGYGNYNLYGTTFSGVLTVANDNPDCDYDGYYQYFLCIVDGVDEYGNINHVSPVDTKSTPVLIPAGGSIQIPVVCQGLPSGGWYMVIVTNSNSGSWTEQIPVGGVYATQPAFETYAADGTQTIIKPDNTGSFAVPVGVLAVNLTGTVSSLSNGVTPNNEPNCVYILGSDETVPAGLESANIIRFDAVNNVYTADNITLTDNSPFHAPVDFTADKVAFNYHFTTAADGTNGWNTIMLPFDVTRVTADNEDIGWFTSSTDEHKQFWLKEFTSDAAATVNFDYVSGTTMKANTPYIVAFPGSRWGTDWDLSGKTIQFIGENCTVYKAGTTSTKTGGNFRFLGSTVQDNTENIYCINDDGNRFELRTTGGSAPFRAYFKPGIFDRELTSLSIGSGDGTTGIRSIDSSQRSAADGQWYNLNGQRVGKPTKGLYINNGKKIVVK